MSFPITTGDLVTAADLNNLRGILDTDTADGSSTTLEVTGLAQTHHDLLVVIDGEHDGSAALRSVTVTFNSDTGSNYRWIRVTTADNGDPARFSSQSASSILLGSFAQTASAYGSSARLYVSDYSASGGHQVMWQANASIGNSAGDSRNYQGSGQHATGAAITSIQVNIGTDEWASGSTLRIYGIGVQ